MNAIRGQLLRTAGALVLGAASLSAQVVEHRLANGLLVLVKRGVDTRTVSVDQAFFVGTVDDSLRGIAHLVEHLAMRETLDGRGLAARYDALGVEGGAYTDANITTFGMSKRGGIGALDTLLGLARERMDSLALTTAALNVERERARIEAGRGRIDPWSATLFGNHRLRAGSAQTDIARIGRVAVVEFWRRFYSAGNTILVVSAPLPDSVVLARVERALSLVRSGVALPRSVFRDSTVIAAGAWGGVGAGGAWQLAVVVPGPQHPWRPRLEAAIRALRPSSDGVTERVDDTSPVSVLTFSALDTLGAADRIERRRRGLVNVVREVAGTVAADTRLDAASLVRCEAAGAWRLCLGGDDAPGSRDGLATALSSAPARAPGIQLWPAAIRGVPNPVGAVAERPAVTWIAPDSGPIAWRRTVSGLEWAAREGGYPDSVLILAVIARRDPAPSRGAVAALELWARLWSELRLPDGTRVDSALLSVGARVSVRSVPYPVLATGDAFVKLGVMPTPLGVSGVEFTIRTAAAAASRALALVHHALAAATTDTTSFTLLKNAQVQLLDRAATFSTVALSTRRRQLMVPPAPSVAARFVPDSPAAQATEVRAATMEGTMAAARILTEAGAGRVVILGAGEELARSWISESGFGTLSALHWGNPDASCSRPDSTVRSVDVDSVPQQVRIHAFACWPADTSIARRSAVALANAVIGGSEDALLAHRLRTELGTAYEFESRIVDVWDAPLAVWTLVVSTQASAVEQTVGDIRATLARAIATGPSQSLFEDTRRSLIDKRRFASGDGDSWLAAVLWRGQTPEVEVDAIRRVTIDHVRAELASGWTPARVGFVAPIRLPR